MSDFGEEIRRSFLEGRYEDVVAAIDAAGEKGRSMNDQAGHEPVSIDPKSIGDIPRRKYGMEDLTTMFHEIRLGVKVEDSKVANLSEEHRALWDRLTVERNEARARGEVIEAPTYLF